MNESKNTCDHKNCWKKTLLIAFVSFLASFVGTTLALCGFVHQYRPMIEKCLNPKPQRILQPIIRDYHCPTLQKNYPPSSKKGFGRPLRPYPINRPNVKKPPYPAFRTPPTAAPDSNTLPINNSDLPKKVLSVPEKPETK